MPVWRDNDKQERFREGSGCGRAVRPCQASEPARALSGPCHLVGEHRRLRRPVPRRPAPLVSGQGNPGKITMAKALLGAIASHFPSVLLDAGYMKRRLVVWALDRAIAVIGQIRRDSALFRIPVPPAKRQRPKKYGDRITSADALPVTQKQTSAYGGRLMRWCGITCRFLRGLDVRVVRISMRTNKGWTKDRLVLSTDTTLCDEDIIIGYSRRWPTEPLYRDL